MMNGDGTISKRIQSIMSDRTNKSSLTLRCLKPYLVLYRSLGLLPLHFDSDDDGGIVPAGWSWKRPGWKLYSSVVLLIVTAYLADKLPGQLVMGSLSSDDAIHLLEAANTSSFSLNVSVTLFMCFLYLSRRLCGLIQRMVRCEKELLGLGCCSLDGDRVTIISCWAVLALGIVATLANESVYAIRRHEDHSMESSATMATLTLFRTVSTAFAAGAWPFVDYSVIQLSLVLSCYQRHLRQLIEDGWTSADLSRKERFRMSYLEVQALIKDADEIFSPAVLIGSLSCVAHLILQINIGLRMEYRPDEHQHLTDVMQTTWTSAAYVALRFCASSYFAEKIHEEKGQCIRELIRQQSVMEPMWNSDLEMLLTKRFIVQLAQPLGFTGWGFFRLGKRYVIAMSGTILTYEVVLLDMTKPRQTNIVINNLTKTT